MYSVSLLSISFCFFFFSSRRRHTRCALVTGVQTCALPILRSFNLIRSGHEPHRAGGQAPWLRGDRLDAPHYAAHLFYRLRSISGRGAFISAALAPQCLTAIHATPQTLVGLLLNL